MRHPPNPFRLNIHKSSISFIVIFLVLDRYPSLPLDVGRLPLLSAAKTIMVDFDDDPHDSWRPVRGWELLCESGGGSYSADHGSGANVSFVRPYSSSSIMLGWMVLVLEWKLTGEISVGLCMAARRRSRGLD